jgi:putative FmdB family regulatory protein
MPLYPFHCRSCGEDFERFLRPAEAALGVPCPSCGGPSRQETGAKAADDSPPLPGPVCGVKTGT